MFNIRKKLIQVWNDIRVRNDDKTIPLNTKLPLLQVTSHISLVKKKIRNDASIKNIAL